MKELSVGSIVYIENNKWGYIPGYYLIVKIDNLRLEYYTSERCDSRYQGNMSKWFGETIKVQSLKVLS